MTKKTKIRKTSERVTPKQRLAEVESERDLLRYVVNHMAHGASPLRARGPSRSSVHVRADLYGPGRADGGIVVIVSGIYPQPAQVLVLDDALKMWAQIYRDLGSKSTPHHQVAADTCVVLAELVKMRDKVAP